MSRSRLRLFHLALLCVASSAFKFSLNPGSYREKLYLPSRVRLTQPQALYSNNRGNEDIKRKNILKSPIYNINFRKTGSFQYASRLSVSQMAQLLDYELCKQPWFTTGQVNPIYFSQDFVAVDIDGEEYDGIGEYAEAMYNQYDQGASKAQIISCEYSDTHTVTVTSRISGRKYTTLGHIKKMVDLKPYLQYTFYRLCPESGLIISQVDRASIPVWDIYITGTLPILDKLISSQTEEEVPDRTVERPGFMKSNSFMNVFSGKKFINKFLTKDDDADEAQDGIEATEVFSYDNERVDSKISFSDESQDDSDDPSTLSTAVTDYMDALSSGELVDFNVDDLTEALNAIEKHCDEGNKGTAQEVDLGNTAVAFAQNIHADEPIDGNTDDLANDMNHIEMHLETPDQPDAEEMPDVRAEPAFSGFAHADTTQGTATDGTEESSSETIPDVPAGPVFSGFAHAYDNQVTASDETEKNAVEGQLSNTATGYPESLSVSEVLDQNNDDELTSNLEHTNIGNTEGKEARRLFFAVTETPKVENEDLAQPNQDAVRIDSETKISTTLEDMREKVSNQPRFMRPKGVEDMRGKLEDKLKFEKPFSIENFSMKSVDVDKIKDVVLSVGENLSSMAADIDPDTVKNATITSVNALTTIGKGFWSATKFVGKVLSDKHKSSTVVSDAKIVKDSTIIKSNIRKKLEDNISDEEDQLPSSSLPEINAGIDVDSAESFETLAVDPEVQETQMVGSDVDGESGILSIETHIPNIENTISQDPDIIAHESGVQNDLSSHGVAHVGPKASDITPVEKFATSSIQDDLLDGEVNRKFDTSGENKDTVPLSSEEAQTKQGLIWVENELLRLETDYLDLVASKTTDNAENFLKPVEQPSDLPNNLPYDPPAKTSSNIVQENPVDVSNNMQEACLSAEDQHEDYELSLENLEADNAEDVSSPVESSSALPNDLAYETVREDPDDVSIDVQEKLLLAKDQSKGHNLALENELLRQEADYKAFVRPKSTSSTTDYTTKSSKDMESKSNDTKSSETKTKTDYLSKIRSVWKNTNDNVVSSEDTPSPINQSLPSSDSYQSYTSAKSSTTSYLHSEASDIDGRSSMKSKPSYDPPASNAQQPSVTSRLPYDPPTSTTSSIEHESTSVSPLQPSSYLHSEASDIGGHSSMKSKPPYDPPASNAQQTSATSRLPYDPPTSTTSSIAHESTSVSPLQPLSHLRAEASDIEGHSRMKSKPSYDPLVPNVGQTSVTSSLPYDPPTSTTSSIGRAKVGKSVPFGTPAPLVSNGPEKSSSAQSLSSQERRKPSSVMHRPSFLARSKPLDIEGHTHVRSRLPYTPPPSMTSSTASPDTRKHSPKSPTAVDFDKEVEALSKDLDRLTSAGLDALRPLEREQTFTDNNNIPKYSNDLSNTEDVPHTTSVFSDQLRVNKERAPPSHTSYQYHENISQDTNDSENPFCSDSLPEYSHQTTCNPSSVSSSYLDDLSKNDNHSKNPFDNFQP